MSSDHHYLLQNVNMRDVGLETLFKSNYDLKIKFLQDIYIFLPSAYVAPSVQCLIVVCCPLPNFSPSMFLNGIFCFFSYSS